MPIHDANLDAVQILVGPAHAHVVGAAKDHFALTARTTIPAAEALLGAEVHCLNHGFVVPVDYMGGDADIVAAARASYGPSGRPLHDDRGLLRYLKRHKHTGPFEMAEAKWLIRAPIFIARQMLRHRTANVNEQSLRYSPPLDLYYVPEPGNIEAQATDNKQGRGVKLSPEDAALAHRMFAEGYDEPASKYEALAGRLGVARELARTVLPVSLFTQWVWKIDLHNLLHFLELRLHARAQYEMRVYAEALAGFVRAWCPWSWEAFEEYTLGAVTFGATERRIINRVVEDGDRGAWRWIADEEGLKGRELEEFLAKFP